MKFLVTGAQGQLGTDLVKQLFQRGFTDVLATDVEEMNILNQEEVRKTILSYKPDVIFHCAAWTRVDDAEDESNQKICNDININGTENILQAALEIKAKIIYISTDYVFDGFKDGEYYEDDPTNPQNVYGTSKLKGEEIVKGYDKSFIVRTSWVFGGCGNNFVKTMLRLGESKEEIGVVSDQIGSPTYTGDLAAFLIDLSQTDAYGVYHATNEGFCSWSEFAEYIFQKENKNVKVNRLRTEDYVTKAKRPKNSRLNKEKLKGKGLKPLPTWQEGVDKYLIELMTINKKEF